MKSPTFLTDRKPAESQIEPITDPTSNEVPVVTPIDPAELTESGTWDETQVIASIKNAHSRNKCPDRALRGQATMRLGDVAGGPLVGALVLTKPRKRTRIRRFLGYLSS